MNPRTRRLRKQRAALCRTVAASLRSVEVVPPPCDPRIHSDGTLMFQTASIGRPWHIEPWVQRIAKSSGQPVDWHFAGGRVMVLALGDLAKVRAAIRKHMPEHDALFRESMKQWDFGGDRPPYRPGWWTKDDEAEQDTAPRLVATTDGGFALYDPCATAIIAALVAT